jgi:hypothetical protein
MESMNQHLSNLGFTVFEVVEASTLFSSMKYPFPGAPGTSREEQLLWEERKMRLQMSLEDLFVQIGESSSNKVVILCDRGVLDSKHFVGADDFKDILSNAGWSEEVFLNRYDLVVHITSAAVGQPDIYEKYKANNPARWETVEQAAEQDVGLKACWMGHRHHRTVDNSTDFDTKIANAVETITGHLGVQVQTKHKVRGLARH